MCVCVNFFLLGHKLLVGNVLVKRYFESNYQGVGQVAIRQGWGGGGGGGSRSNQKTMFNGQILQQPLSEQHKFWTTQESTIQQFCFFHLCMMCQLLLMHNAIPCTRKKKTELKKKSLITHIQHCPVFQSHGHKKVTNIQSICTTVLRGQ